MKPMLKYRGGKSRELGYILPHIPIIKGRYIEPFFGGGAVYFELEPQNSIINDINEPLITFYLGIRDNFNIVSCELADLQKLYEINRENFEKLKAQAPEERVNDSNESLYYNLRDMFNYTIQPAYHPATIYYFINKTAYSGMVRYNAEGKYNVPYGRYRNFNTALVTKSHSTLLKHADIMCGSYTSVFNLECEGDFFFLDPPYDCVFSDYGNLETKDGFGEDLHRKLANDIRNLSSKTLMVIGKTPLTTELYSDLIISEYDKSYAVNIRNRFKSEGKHILIANYK